MILLALIACGETPLPPVDVPWTTATMFEPDGTPARRLEAGAGALGTRLVITGGFSGNVADGLPTTMEVLTFDTLAGAWGALPPLPVAWNHANVAAIGGSVYVLGGLSFDPQLRTFFPAGETFVLEPQATGGPDPDWKSLDPLPAGQERGAAAVVVSGGHIFLLGGATEVSPLDTILDFDVLTRTWASNADGSLPLPRLLTIKKCATWLKLKSVKIKNAALKFYLMRATVWLNAC